MNDILYSLCRHSLSMMNGWLPYPSTLLSKSCGVSLYKTRKELKSLKENGLIQSTMEVIRDEDGCTILRGYTITKKAEETQEYKKAFEEEKRICKEIFDIDIDKESE